MAKLTKENSVLILLIAVKFILQYQLIHHEFELHRDEYLHLDQAKHLAWGYLSVPPFTSWISYTIHLLGKGVFWVKFFPALFGVLTMIVVWKTAKQLNGGLFAMALSATAVLFSAILRVNIRYQPNSADVFFWTLVYYLLIRYINSQNRKYILLAALAFAFGFLNKYNILFLAMGLFPALLLSPHRKILSLPYLWYAVATAFIIVLPNLYWQYQNDFPVIHHMKELSDTQLVNVKRSDFLKEQLLFFINSFFLIVLAFVSFFAHPDFRKYRMFFWSLVFTLLLFLWFKAKGYYAIGLYPIFLAFGAVYLERFLKDDWKYHLRPVAFLLVGIPFYYIVKIAFPFIVRSKQPPER